MSAPVIDVAAIARAVQTADTLASIIYGGAGAATVADERPDADAMATIESLPLAPVPSQSRRDLLTLALASEQHELEVIRSGLPNPAKAWVAYAAGVSSFGRTRREAMVQCLVELADARREVA